MPYIADYDTGEMIWVGDGPDPGLNTMPPPPPPEGAPGLSSLFSGIRSTAEQAVQSMTGTMEQVAPGINPDQYVLDELARQGYMIENGQVVGFKGQRGVLPGSQADLLEGIRRIEERRKAELQPVQEFFNNQQTQAQNLEAQYNPTGDPGYDVAQVQSARLQDAGGQYYNDPNAVPDRPEMRNPDGSLHTGSVLGVNPVTGEPVPGINAENGWLPDPERPGYFFKPTAYTPNEPSLLQKGLGAAIDVLGSAPDMFNIVGRTGAVADALNTDMPYAKQIQEAAGEAGRFIGNTISPYDFQAPTPSGNTGPKGDTLLGKAFGQAAETAVPVKVWEGLLELMPGIGTVPDLIEGFAKSGMGDDVVRALAKIASQDSNVAAKILRNLLGPGDYKAGNFYSGLPTGGGRPAQAIRDAIAEGTSEGERLLNAPIEDGHIVRAKVRVPDGRNVFVTGVAGEPQGSMVPVTLTINGQTVTQPMPIKLVENLNHLQLTPEEIAAYNRENLRISGMRGVEDEATAQAREAAQAPAQPTVDPRAPGNVIRRDAQGNVLDTGERKISRELSFDDDVPAPPARTVEPSRTGAVQRPQPATADLFADAPDYVPNPEDELALEGLGGKAAPTQSADNPLTLEDWRASYNRMSRDTLKDEARDARIYGANRMSKPELVNRLAEWRMKDSGSLVDEAVEAAPTPKAAPVEPSPTSAPEVDPVLAKEKDRISKLKNPNDESAQKALAKLEDKYDTGEAEDLLSDFTGLERDDFDTAAEFREARKDAWDEFVEAFQRIGEDEDSLIDEVPDPLEPLRDRAKELGIKGGYNPNDEASLRKAIENAEYRKANPEPEKPKVIRDETNRSTRFKSKAAQELIEAEKARLIDEATYGPDKIRPDVAARINAALRNAPVDKDGELNATAKDALKRARQEFEDARPDLATPPPSGVTADLQQSINITQTQGREAATQAGHDVGEARIAPPPPRLPKIDPQEAATLTGKTPTETRDRYFQHAADHGRLRVYFDENGNLDYYKTAEEVLDQYGDLAGNINAIRNGLKKRVEETGDLLPAGDIYVRKQALNKAEQAEVATGERVIDDLTGTAPKVEDIEKVHSFVKGNLPDLKPDELEDAVAGIAHSLGVDEATVRHAIRGNYKLVPKGNGKVALVQAPPSEARLNETEAIKAATQSKVKRASQVGREQTQSAEVAGRVKNTLKEAGDKPVSNRKMVEALSDDFGKLPDVEVPEVSEEERALLKQARKERALELASEHSSPPPSSSIPQGEWPRMTPEERFQRQIDDYERQLDAELDRRVTREGRKQAQIQGITDQTDGPLPPRRGGGNSGSGGGGSLPPSSGGPSSSGTPNWRPNMSTSMQRGANGSLGSDFTWKRAVGNLVKELLAMPRETLASTDMSGFLRQGWLQTLAHPITASKSFKTAVNVYFDAFLHNGDMADDILKSLGSKHNAFKTEGKVKLAIGQVDDVVGGTGKVGRVGEETIPKSFIESVPLAGRHFKGSRQAYEVFMAKLRDDLFDQSMDLMLGDRTPIAFGRTIARRTGVLKNDPAEALAAIQNGGNLNRYDPSAINQAVQQLTSMKNGEMAAPGVASRSGKGWSAKEKAIMEKYDPMIDRATKAMREMNNGDLSAKLTPDSPEVQTLIKWINISTGKGNLPEFLNSAVASEVGKLAFAPSLIMSRVQTPWYFLDAITPGGQLPAPVRRKIASDTVTAVSTVMGILALAHETGVGEVSLDPRSSDFGKLKIGNTRVDPWGGFQQVARLVYSLGAGVADAAGVYDYERKGLGGQMYAADWHDSVTALQQFLANKLAPVPATLMDVGTGAFGGKENLSGAPTPMWARRAGHSLGLNDMEDFELEGKDDFLKDMLSRITPLFLQDMVAAIQEQGVVRGSMLGGTAFLGIGASTFQTPSEKLNAHLNSMEVKYRDPTTGETLTRWDQLDPADRRDARLKNPSLDKELRNMPRSEIGYIAENRKADIDKAFDDFLETGDRDGLQEALKKIGTKYAAEFGDKFTSKQTNKTEWQQKLSEYFDGFKMAEEAADKENPAALLQAEWDSHFRANLNPQEKAKLDQVLQSADNPYYGALKRSRDYLQTNYWEYRDKHWSDAASKIKVPYDGQMVPVSELYDTPLEFAYAARIRTDNKYDANDFRAAAIKINSKVNEDMQELLESGPAGARLDAMMYFWGYRDTVRTKLAQDYVTGLAQTIYEIKNYDPPPIAKR